MAAAAAAVMLVALVAEDPAVLRNAPRDTAPAEASLWRGDWLEVRGETAGFLRVYDHRRERPGYVRPAQVRVYSLDPAAAPELAAVVRFLRDATGYESLGIGYAALALRAAPAGAADTEILAAIGTMADRLARRASARRSDARDATLAAHVEVAESYGVKFKVVEALGGRGDPARTRLCYDGEAWAEVLAAPSALPLERARAALFLAGARCADAGTLSPAEERALNDQRIQALETVDFPTASSIPASLLGRVRLRLAEALSWRAFDDARQGAADAAARSEAAAVRRRGRGARGGVALRGRTGRRPVGRQARGRDRHHSACARRELRPRRRPGKGQQDAPARRALHLRCRLGERAALGAVGHGRDHRRPAAGGLDGAVGDSRGRSRLDLRYADARHRRSGRRRGLRRVRRLLA
jgi:hypothetical protein